MNGPLRLVVGFLGFAVGAAAVVGSSLAFAEPEPRGAVRVSSHFCSDMVTGVADTWGLTVLPQETVTGDRDELTVCEAASASGDVRLTLTVLALAEEDGRDAAERTSTMLDLACTAIQPGGGSDATGDGEGDGEGCDSSVETVDRLVGNASSLVTGDGRAVVTVVFTAPPDRAVGTAREVAALAQVLSSGVG